MSQYKSVYLCWYCGADIIVPIDENLLTNYEKTRSGDGTTIKETYSKPCPGCHVILHVSFKQYQNSNLAKLNNKKGRE